MATSKLPPTDQPGPNPPKRRAAATGRATGGRTTAGHAATGRRDGRRPSRVWRYGFLLAVGLMALFGAAGVGIFLGYVHSMPPLEDLEGFDPAQITRVFDRSGATPIGDFKKERRQVVRIQDIPPMLQNAFIAIEDSRFYKHCGIDPIGIMRALMVYFKTHSMKQGASTITQQMARNVIVKVGKDKSFDRKIREAMYAIQIERRYSKDQILEFYLNKISFGGNVGGVWAAAQTYFGKNLDQLTIGECALLAGIPNAPSKYNPKANKDLAHKRRNIVLDCMYEQSMINKTQLAQAKAEEIEVTDGLRTVSLYPSFLNGLEWDLLKFYKDTGITSDTLRTKGYQITATIDPAIQEACTKALREGLVGVERMWQGRKEERLQQELKDKTLGSKLEENQIRLMRIDKVNDDSVQVSLEQYKGTIPKPDTLPFYEPEACLKRGEYLDVLLTSVDQRTGQIRGKFAFEKPVQGSIVVLDSRSAEVLALVGGDETIGDWNNAIRGGRQPGSCFKPFFYATAFERGFPPNGVIVDEPVEYWTGAKPYKPIDYEKNFPGPMTLIEGLEHSRNVVTIRLFEALGIKKALDTVRRFDFTGIDLPRWTLRPEISICLGTIDVSPFELAAAYQPFANLGWAERPQFFRSIVDQNGRVAVMPKRLEDHQIISPIAAYQTQYALRQVVVGGTGKAEIGDKLPSPPNPPICGKTGTTNDCRDAWFVGFTPDLILVCQAGFNPPHSLGPRMSGGKVVGPVWREAFKEILKTRGNWKMSFESPADEGIELANICAVSGMRAGDNCAGSGHKIYPNVPFERGKAPRATCTGYPQSALIAPLNGSLPAPRSGIAHSPTTPYPPGMND